MPNTVSIAELERMSKAPSAVPTWLLREALQELLDLRHGARPSKA